MTQQRLVVRVLITILFCMSGVPASADQHAPAPFSLADQIDAYMQPFLANHLFKGVLMIAHGNKVDFLRTYGTQRTAKFRIASITKTFTAAAIELLAQRKKLSLNDPLIKFLPQFPNASHITLKQLLSHQAGLADPDYAYFAHRHATLDDVVANIGAKPPLFAPGTGGQYSNAGYVVLAKVVEAVSGTPFGDFIVTEFAAPLQLTSTSSDDPNAKISGRAAGYVPGPPPTFETNAPFEEVTAYTGSGNLLSSADDLLTWANAVASNKIVDLSEVDYPYGWGRRAYLQHHVIEQSGEETGFISYLVHDAELSLTIIVLSNLEAGPNDRIGKSIYQLATVSLPSFPARYRGSIAALSQGAYTGMSGTFTVTKRGSDYYAQWEGASLGEYLMPSGPNRFFVPQDSSTITIVSARKVLRQWGTDPAVPFEITQT